MGIKKIRDRYQHGRMDYQIPNQEIHAFQENRHINRTRNGKVKTGTMIYVAVQSRETIYNPNLRDDNDNPVKVRTEWHLIPSWDTSFDNILKKAMEAILKNPYQKTYKILEDSDISID